MKLIPSDDRYGVSQDPDVIAEALDQADRIVDFIDDLPEAGEAFGLWVSASCRSMARNIERHRRVTDAQLIALDNWESGLAKWFDQPERPFMDETRPKALPFTIAVDGRDKARYAFTGLHGDARDHQRPLLVTTQWQHLTTGDYSIQGLEDRVAVERKSLADLYGSLGAQRLRFESEHWRLSELQAAIVVIEASWHEILHAPPSHSKPSPKTVWRTAIAWQLCYGVPGVPADTRGLAEIYTFRFLEKFWKDYHDPNRCGESGRHGTDSPEGVEHMD